MPHPETLIRLGRRLDALLEAHDRFCSFPSSSANGAQSKMLSRVAAALSTEYLAFRSSLSAIGISMPPFDTERLQSLVRSAEEDKAKATRDANLAEMVLLLSLIRSDIEAVTDDGQDELRSRAERAFVHLQWSIASSRAVRASWARVYSIDEPACEALGATHLLAHGVFAFKAHSPSARTDLVFNEPIDAPRAKSISEGLVLTEWKRQTDAKKLDEVIAQAAKQADLYVDGVLAGQELRRIRYVVVVSEDRLTMPGDLVRDDYVVRPINIAVRPKSPSKSAPDLVKAGASPAL